MHHRSARSFACVALFLAAGVGIADEAIDGVQPGIWRAPDGGGAAPVDRSVPCLTDERRSEVRARIRESVGRLRATGRLQRTAQGTAPQLSWPLIGSQGLNEPGFHGVSNFVDQDPSFPNFLQDYQCGTRTYDLSSGYNHRGIDYFIWPYAFQRMDADQVQIVAAAPGTIVLKEDGNYDRNCGLNTLDWNAVYVMHADGSVAWYGHMKNGSPTSKGLGDSVARGEFLGVVGSSGSSSGPHLHFELYNAADQLQEPYAGPCNGLNGGSWWIDQREYYDSAINELITGGAEPILGSCPNQGNSFERTAYSRGETIYFTAYYRDQLSSQAGSYVLRRPNGTIYDSWNHNSLQAHYASSYWYWSRNNFAASGPDGEWQFEVTFNGTTVIRPFTIGGSPVGRVPGDQAGEQPLLLDKSTGSSVGMSWGESCLTTDTDYAIYEGTLDSWYDHTPKFCTTFNQTSLIFQPLAASVYYLVVPHNGSREGAYGRDGSGLPRPVGVGACFVQEVGSCP